MTSFPFYFVFHYVLQQCIFGSSHYKFKIFEFPSFKCWSFHRLFGLLSQLDFRNSVSPWDSYHSPVTLPSQMHQVCLFWPSSNFQKLYYIFVIILYIIFGLFKVNLHHHHHHHRVFAWWAFLSFWDWLLCETDII